MSGDEDFIDRWSRRKRATGAGDRAENAGAGPAAAETPRHPPTEPSPPITEEELAALPRIDDLNPDSDIRAFLRPGVPAALKNAALRKMWMLTPAIRDHQDVAVDYAWDWNTPGAVPGSGGRITAESLRKMVDALTGGKEPEDAGRDPVAPSPGAARAGTRPETGDRQNPPGNPNAAAAEQPALPRPRHGGATPQTDTT